MDRNDAQHNLDKLKSFKHTTVKSLKHTAKLFEFLLYELDKMKDRETELPSVFGSYVEEPNYKDYPSEEEEIVELPDIKEPEPEEFIDDASVPLIMAYNAAVLPFRNDEGEHAEEEATEEVQEVEEGPEVREEESGTLRTGEVGWSNNSDKHIIDDEGQSLEIEIVKNKPKKLRIAGEGDKNDLHKEGLERVKARLRAVKKRSKKKRKKVDPE